MKIPAFAITALLGAVVPSSAFVGVNKMTHSPASTTTTALFETMDAYEAQMRAMAAGAPVMSGMAPGSGAATASASSTTTTYNTVAPDNFKLAQRWRKKTKQLATLGPASSTFEMIEKLFLAGADVVSTQKTESFGWWERTTSRQVQNRI